MHPSVLSAAAIAAIGLALPNVAAAAEAPQPPAEATSQPAEATAAPKPPRVDGTYVGIGLQGSIAALRVNSLDTGSPFAGAGGYFRFGQMVLPWFGLGLQLGGNSGRASTEDGESQRVGQGGFLVDLNVVPVPKRVRGLSLRGSFGFGGGAVREDGVDGRSGFGGALFGLGGRYEFFPGADRYRATRGGGFGIGPEIGWTGFTPAARGRPMSNTFFVGLSMTFYFGD